MCCQKEGKEVLEQGRCGWNEIQRICTNTPTKQMGEMYSDKKKDPGGLSKAS